MELIIALEQRFIRTPDGLYRTATCYARPFWDRYLSVFERVRVAARVAEGPAQAKGCARVDGDRVSVLPLPCYVGPRQYLLNRAALLRSVRAIDSSNAALLVRVPGVIGSLLARERPSGQPFGVELVSDPVDAFARGTIEHPLRPFFAWWFRRDLLRLCNSASCSLYVTQRTLQARYPPGSGRSAVGVSDVELSEDAFVSPIGRKKNQAGPFRIVCVGNLEQLYKRQDELLQAVARCVRAGLDARLSLVGDGRLRTQLERLAARLGLEDRVTFLGALPSGPAVRAALDDHDLFILSSHCEGLPRALVEAMARGLPCIATAVGGIPELLPDYALVPPGDLPALSERILLFARDRDLRERAARENLDTARGYLESVLQPKRAAFLGELLRATAAWRAGLGARAIQPELAKGIL